MSKLVVLAALVLAFCTPAFAAEAPDRAVEMGVRSSADPAATVLVDPSFRYLGRTQATVMQGKATAEQYWFGRIEGGQLVRAVVVHFERWNEGVEGEFDYPSFRMRRLGAHDYLHQSFPIENCVLFTPDVLALFEAQAVTTAPHCLATRFVRAVDKARRAEMILFFVEPVAAVDAAPAGLGEGGLPVGYDDPKAPETPWSRIDRRLTEEALRSISVRD